MTFDIRTLAHYDISGAIRHSLMVKVDKGSGTIWYMVAAKNTDKVELTFGKEALGTCH